MHETKARMADRNLGAGTSARERGRLGETGKMPGAAQKRKSGRSLAREWEMHLGNSHVSGNQAKTKEESARDGSQKNELDSSPDLAGEENSRTKNSYRAIPTQKGEEYTAHTKYKR
jgi:hypothetical protein